MRVRFNHREKLVMLVSVIVLLSGGATYAILYGGGPSPIVTNSVDLSRGLVGWWKLDGNSADSTPYKNNGTPTGSPTATTDREGAAGKAVSFNGTSQYYTIGNPSQLQITGSESISMWLKPTSFASRQNPFCKAYGGEFCITTETSGDISYYYGTAGGNTTPYQGFTSTHALVLNSWNHIVIVRDLNAMTLTWYINGLSNSTAATYSSATVSSLASYIGHAYAGYYSGSIDDIRIWNRALNSSEASALYHSYADPLDLASGENGLVGWWKLDGNAKDATPNRNAFTTNTGTLATDREGAANQAYSFSGTACMRQSITPSSLLAITGPFTASSWIYPTTTGTSQMIVRSGTGNDEDYSIYYDGTNKRPYIEWYNGAFQKVYGSNNSVPLSAWSLVTVTRDASNNISFYVNGSFVNTGAGSTPTVGATSYFGLASSSCAGAQQYTGTIDDVRVYNRALSLTEIANIYGNYNASYTISTLQQGLIGWWPLNGNIKDSTPHRDNLTVHGGPTLTTDREGRANSAYTVVDTNNDYFTVPAGSLFNGAAGLTYNIWLMRTSASTGSQWPEIMGANNTHIYYGIRSQIYGDDLTFEYGTSPYAGSTWAQLLIKNPVPLNQWHMFTVTYDGSNLKSYYDGGFMNNQASITLNPAFGGLDIISSGNFNGSVDDPRVWNRALSAGEVSTLYHEYY